MTLLQIRRRNTTRWNINPVKDTSFQNIKCVPGGKHRTKQVVRHETIRHTAVCRNCGPNPISGPCTMLHQHWNGHHYILSNWGTWKSTHSPIWIWSGLNYLLRWNITKETQVRLWGPRGEIGFSSSQDCHLYSLPSLNLLIAFSSMGLLLTACREFTIANSFSQSSTEAQHWLVLTSLLLLLPS